MRYRIYIEKQEAVEVTAFDLRVVDRRRIAVIPSAADSWTVDLAFGSDIVRIADDHDRTIYQTPDEKTIRFAESILNHYAKDSRADHICLARRLEKWAIERN